MGQGLQQRVLGAVVLMGLLVLMAPALFRGGTSHPLARQPLPPPLPAPPVPEVITALDTPAPPIQVLEVAAAPGKLDAQEASGLDSQGQLKAWSLQLGSFVDENNARQLLTRLDSQGYNGYIRKLQESGGRRLYRVYVGPQVRTDTLVTLKARLKAELGLNGILVRYRP